MRTDPDDEWGLKGAEAEIEMNSSTTFASWCGANRLIVGDQTRCAMRAKVLRGRHPAEPPLETE